MRERRVHLNAVFGLVRVVDYDTGQMIQQCCNAIKIKNPHTVSVRHELYVDSVTTLLRLPKHLCSDRPNHSFFYHTMVTEP